VCFCVFDGKSLSYNKKTALGVDERILVLKWYLSTGLVIGERLYNNSTLASVFRLSKNIYLIY